MPYYHVSIYHLDAKEEWRYILEYDLAQNDLRKIIVDPYLKGRKFMVLGVTLRPSEINQILIFRSRKRLGKLILPNGKAIRDENNVSFIVDCLLNDKVKGVYACTPDFITPPAQEREELTETPIKPLGEKKKVFIVHGRDETQALRLQKYLTQTLKVDAEMFEDFKERSGSNTIIEQLEYIKDNVGYAFVIITPDDLGCLREVIDKCRTKTLIGKENIKVESVCKILDNFSTRARQNVVFEHGLFIGSLGRSNVCCLFQKDTEEKPSDIDGILYVGFKKSAKETFPEITEKLRKIGLVN